MQIPDNFNQNEKENLPADDESVKKVNRTSNSDEAESRISDENGNNSIKNDGSAEDVLKNQNENSNENSGDRSNSPDSQPNMYGNEQNGNGYNPNVYGNGQRENSYNPNMYGNGQRENSYNPNMYGNGQSGNGFNPNMYGNNPAPDLGNLSGSSTGKQKKKKKKKQMSGMAVTALVLSLSLVFAAILTGAGFVIITHHDDFVNLFPNSSQDAPDPNAPPEHVYHESDWINPGDLDDDEAIVNVASKCSPSVVAISVKTGMGTSAGSGVIWTKDGYIVTNHHVIENASSITVTLSDNESYRALLVGSDRKHDLALIRINVEGLYPASVGSYESLRVGQTVVAIGNPLGSLAGTVSEGILSSLARDIRVGGTVLNVMQTTAAINPGNSGGGCFDINGNLIGIVNAKASDTGIEGLGFAIPINTVKEVVGKMIANDHSSLKNSIGITSSLLVTKENYEELYSQYNHLRLVQRANGDKPLYGIYVIDDGLVEYAGEEHLENGDVITGLNGKKFEDDEGFNDLLSKCKEGEKVELNICRLEKDQSSIFGSNYNLKMMNIQVKVIQMFR